MVKNVRFLFNDNLRGGVHSPPPKTLILIDQSSLNYRVRSHFDDIRKLLDVLMRLVDMGNTVVVIEHNLDVIKSADHVIDLGPEGGPGGGRIVASGTPEAVAHHKESLTGRFLRPFF